MNLVVRSRSFAEKAVDLINENYCRLQFVSKGEHSIDESFTFSKPFFRQGAHVEVDEGGSTVGMSGCGGMPGERGGKYDSAAIAFASIVFPQPGGP